MAEIIFFLIMILYYLVQVCRNVFLEMKYDE